jgi:hypothetical protein
MCAGKWPITLGRKKQHVTKLAVVSTVMNLPALKREDGSFSPTWQTVGWWTEDLGTVLFAPAVCPAQ